MAVLPATMPAAVYRGPRRLEVEERPVPSPAAGEVLVEVSHCGVCGSDLHFVLEGWGRPGSVGGHEYAGRVVDLGAGVTGWAVGDGVVGGPRPACGECRACAAGRPSLCAGRDAPGAGGPDGAFAGYVQVPAGALVPVPAGLDLRTAALAEPLAVALHAINRSGVAAGDRALVCGAGPIGALVVAALRARDVEVVVTEPGEARRRLAAGLGAEVVLPDELDVPPFGDPGRVVEGAVDVAIECSGRASAMEAALTQLVRGGTLVLVGAGIDPPRFDHNRILVNELVVTGAFEYDAGGVDDAVGLLASGALPVDDLLEPTDVALPDLLAAMERLATGELAGKVLVTPNPGGTDG
jgi:(R,R)-butanediol dehydrogenase / meso-butanediol dehydrogenase / diacetyl reductase